MTPLTLAYSPWWIAVCAGALLLIYWDWDKRTRRQMVSAVLIALMAGSVLYAATVPNPDYCEQFRQDGYSWWLLLFLGC